MSDSAASWEWPRYTKTIHRSGYASIDPTNPALSANGKVVFVTGGGIGLGRHIASAFVTAGAKAVAILGRREAPLLETRKQLEAQGSAKILHFVADVTDGPALKSAFETMAKEAGPVDVVVANAGYLSTPGPAATSDVGEWWKGFEINIKATLLTWQAWYPVKAAQDAVFVSLNTLAAHAGAFPGVSGYVASKAGLASLVQCLYAEGKEDGVRVVSMHPGVLDTEMNAKSGLPLSKDDMSLPASFALWLASTQADWTGGRFLWAHWDVDELAEMKEEIVKNNELTLQLGGWPKM